MSELLSRRPDIDAVVCVNDLPAVGALMEMRGRGVEIPSKVQLIGFDDQPLMDVIGLSTVHQPMGTLGEWAARAMRDLLENPSRQAAPPASQQLPVTLIHRATTRTISKHGDQTREAARRTS
jgi:DNA-binding LacI/PurR family transcriptional regulator